MISLLRIPISSLFLIQALDPHTLPYSSPLFFQEKLRNLPWKLNVAQ